MGPDPFEIANALDDGQIVERILAGEAGLFEILVRRHNRRLYRTIRAIVQSEEEAEDVVQEAYVRAYEHLAQFAGRCLFSTWLTRIALYESWNRVKRRGRESDISSRTRALNKAVRVSHTPENDLLATETRTILEQAIDALPDAYRSVFMMRSLEEMSTAETAKCLEISEMAVKVRLGRARHMLRRALYELASAASSDAFHFLGERCDRVTAFVLSRIAKLPRNTAAAS